MCFIVAGIFSKMMELKDLLQNLQTQKAQCCVTSTQQQQKYITGYILYKICREKGKKMLG